MFVTFLHFTDRREAAASFMAGHNAWIAQGFADGIFLCAGSLDHSAGGMILAAGEGRVAYDARVQADPFVVHGIVTAETHEIDAKRTIPALAFLTAAA